MKDDEIKRRKEYWLIPNTPNLSATCYNWNESLKIIWQYVDKNYKKLHNKFGLSKQWLIELLGKECWYFIKWKKIAIIDPFDVCKNAYNLIKAMEYAIENSKE